MPQTTEGHLPPFDFRPLLAGDEFHRGWLRESFRSVVTPRTPALSKGGVSTCEQKTLPNTPDEYIVGVEVVQVALREIPRAF